VKGLLGDVVEGIELVHRDGPDGVALCHMCIPTATGLASAN
jgi:hypothetical protein